MPVGTAGAMKGMHWREVRDAGADIVLGNTYHLMLRPGAERIAALGGLQKFTGWNGPMLTDSGGYQSEFVLFNTSSDRSSGTLDIFPASEVPVRLNQ